MKTNTSSDNMTDLIPMYQTLDENQSVLMESLDEDECSGGQISEKKRRLSVDQVKALEKYFELENKLDPERKVKLAQELHLQPRQVAVWFQNRRARWKTKQLERDYGVLKANFDSLKRDYDCLKDDNDSLAKQIREMKAKLCEEDEKEQSDDKAKSVENKEGSSDSDSSAILNEDNNSIVMNTKYQLTDAKSIMCDAEDAYQPQFVKIEEEHDFFSGDESCNFFSDDQAPTLQWYCEDQWNLPEEG